MKLLRLFLGLLLTSVVLATGSSAQIIIPGTGGSGGGGGGGPSSLPGDPVACAANRFVTDLDINGVLTCAQPASSGLSDAANVMTYTGVGRSTGKQLVPRAVLQTVVSNEIEPDCDDVDIAIVPTLSAGVTVKNPLCGEAGNPANGQEITFRFADTSTARGITWGNAYTAENGISLPASTSGLYYDWIMFRYNSTSGKWGALASSLGLSKGVTTLASSSTFTCPGDTSSRCEMQMTGGAGTLTVANITGTPTNGDMIWLSFLCTNAQTFSWNAAFIDGVSFSKPTTCAADTAKWLEVLVRYSSVLTKWEVLVGTPAGGGAVTFTAVRNLPITGVKLPSSNPATIDVSETNNRLLFDASTSECVIWPFFWPSDWSSGGTLKVQYSMTSATSGGVSIDASVMAVTPGDAADINTESYDTVNNCDDATVPGTAGFLDQISCTLTNKDSVAAGDYAKIKLCRAVADSADTATGDMEVVGAELSYTH